MFRFAQQDMQATAVALRRCAINTLQCARSRQCEIRWRGSALRRERIAIAAGAPVRQQKSGADAR
jgi:hypothetical protein